MKTGQKDDVEESIVEEMAVMLKRIREISLLMESGKGDRRDFGVMLQVVGAALAEAADLPW